MWRAQVSPCVAPSAVLLRADVKPAPEDGTWRVGNLMLGARLTDAAFPDGELTVKLRGDLEVDVNQEIGALEQSACNRRRQRHHGFGERAKLR